MILRRVAGWPSWEMRNPFEELERLRKMLDSMAGGTLRETSSGVFPLINVTEDKDNFYLRAELPGITTEDLDISVTANGIAISGKRKIPDAGSNAVYHRRERESGSFSRMLTLPGQIEGAKVEATMADGVLTVLIPKSEKVKPRQIAIRTM